VLSDFGEKIACPGTQLVSASNKHFIPTVWSQIKLQLNDFRRGSMQGQKLRFEARTETILFNLKNLVLKKTICR